MTNTTLNSKSNIFNHVETLITIPSLVREQWLSSELSVREVLVFEQRFGSKHLLLACHAALPLILTPELLNLIHINFLDEEQIPWVAEVDFLLSPLCRPIDEGLFEVEPSVREVLLVELENQCGFERPFELAKFLQVYLAHQSGWEQRSELTCIQLWVAQAYMNPDQVVEDLTNLLKSSLSEENYLLNIPEQIQIVTAIEILVEPLERTNKPREYKSLLNSSRVLAKLLYSERDSMMINKPLSTLIHRYPYLYDHCLLSEDSSYEQQQTVRQIQARNQQHFEQDLSQYITFQVQRAQAMHTPLEETPERIIQPIKNPTLLSDRELGAALKQFVGKVEGSYTYQDVAQSFLTHTSQISSYKEFKEDLYEYLIASIDSGYGKRKFNERLQAYLKNTLSHSDSQKPTEFLILQTCSQLLNFLVVESPQRPHHFIFVDLITNLGATMTTVLLLKIVLLCRKVKPDLEKRFSILFNHYESVTIDGILWLVKSLENWNIASSIHFGSSDLSSLNLLSRRPM